MDPDLHDEPMYLQLLAYVGLIALVLTLIVGMYFVLRGTIDPLEDYEAVQSHERSQRP